MKIKANNHLAIIMAGNNNQQNDDMLNLDPLLEATVGGHPRPRREREGQPQPTVDG